MKVILNYFIIIIPTVLIYNNVIIWSVKYKVYDLYVENFDNRFKIHDITE